MTVEFKLPDLGEGIHEAEILDIKVKEGENVKADQILFEVETDKAAVEVPSPFTGKVEKIFFKVGDTAKVGNVLITIATADKPVTQERAKPENVPEAVPVGARETAGMKVMGGGNGKTNTATPTPAARTSPATGPVPAAPATRKLARDLNVDLRNIQGSGPGGRVTKEDVRGFSEGVPSAARSSGSPSSSSPTSERTSAPSAKPVTPIRLPEFSKQGKVERVPLRSLRKKIATNMAESWAHVPRVSNFDEADVTQLEKTRQKHEKQVAKAGGKLTMTAITIKAVVSALKKFPQFNSSLDEEKSEIVYKHFYNIGIAVATDRGLIVPVIKDADQKNIVDLSIELADLAQKTRDNKIELDRLQGGTFTISNIGPIGGTGAVPMVNFPEVAIMAMARAKETPVVRDGQIVIRTILPLSLSFDHRVCDGAEAAMFLRHIAECLEDPFQILLGD
jgi:pyruvate dehydrogenase E2 component (dihydrolipoamide acetyltransferase)